MLVKGPMKLFSTSVLQPTMLGPRRTLLRILAPACTLTRESISEFSMAQSGAMAGDSSARAWLLASSMSVALPVSIHQPSWTCGATW